MCNVHARVKLTVYGCCGFIHYAPPQPIKKIIYDIKKPY